MASAVERQRAFMKREAEAGRKQVSGIINEAQAPYVLSMLRQLRANPDLVPATLRNVRTGKFEKVQI